jgi:hypothetical protein
MARDLQGVVAPFRHRAAADAVDAVLVLTLELGLWSSGLVSEPLPWQGADALDAFAALWTYDAVLLAPALVALPLVGTLYVTLSRSLMGRTPGERALGLWLVDRASGQPPGPFRAAAHALCGWLGALPLLAGWLSPIVTKTRQGPAEWLTGTRLLLGPPTRR